VTDRRAARALALQSLCQLEVQGDRFLAELDGFLADENASDTVREDARRLAHAAWSGRDQADDRIRRAAEHWDLARMSLVDRNILRVAVCELLTRPDVPPAVVINEAVEIARQFGSADSPAFVNGVLDAAYRQLKQA